MKKTNLAVVRTEEVVDAPPSLKEYAEKMAELRIQKEAVESEEKKINSQLEEISSAMLRIMQSEDLQSFKTSRGTFYVHVTERAKIIDPTMAFKFLRKIKCGAIIKETVNSNTLSSTYKQLREAGKIDNLSAPKFGIEVFLDEDVRLSRAKV